MVMVFTKQINWSWMHLTRVVLDSHHFLPDQDFIFIRNACHQKTPHTGWPLGMQWKFPSAQKPGWCSACVRCERCPPLLSFTKEQLRAGWVFVLCMVNMVTVSDKGWKLPQCGSYRWKIFSGDTAEFWMLCILQSIFLSVRHTLYFWSFGSFPYVFAWKFLWSPLSSNMMPNRISCWWQLCQTVNNEIVLNILVWKRSVSVNRKRARKNIYLWTVNIRDPCRSMCSSCVCSIQRLCCMQSGVEKMRTFFELGMTLQNRRANAGSWDRYLCQVVTSGANRTLHASNTELVWR